ncbi:MAG TPA: LamG-like jellyroll fold domain-containing protein [Polyangia bacterium]|nr:LamG-like jellyroll fold domain-containing protein [Polyangia bacterium]
MARTASASTCTWQSGSSTSYSTGTNWSCNRAPGSTATVDTIVFDSTKSNVNCNMSGNVTNISTVTFNGYSGTFSANTHTLTTSGAWTQGSGTFSGSTAALSIGGLVTMNGGTFTSSSATTALSAGLTVNGGTFNGGGGALNVTGAVSVTSGTLSPGSSSLSATSISVAGGTFTGGSGTVTTTTGNLSVGDSTTYTPDSSLVGYWSFDDSGHTTDSAGGHSLTWSGSPSFPSTNLPSLPFDTASPQYAVAMTGGQHGLTSNLTGISSLCPATVTLSAWYKAFSTDSIAGEVVSGANTYSLRITSSGLVVMKRVATSGSPQWIEYQVPFSNVLDGAWHQIVGVIVTGTGGGMTAYLDGAPAAGGYYVGGTTTQLTGADAVSAAEDPILWNSTTEGAGLAIGYNPSGATGYSFGGTSVKGPAGKSCSSTNVCAIDDVRIYNRALSAAEVATLARGNQTGAASSTFSLAGVANIAGSISVATTGSLTLGSGSTLEVGTGLTVDGKLTANSATITKSGTSRYPFVVGSSSAAAPELDINGLSVQYTDTNGMQVNASGGAWTHASTTFTQFDQVAFGAGAGAGTQNQLLNVFASSLYLTSTGCTFGSGSTYAVKLTSEASSGTGPRLLFANATCATNDSTTGLCASSEKQDDDPGNGVPSATTGGVVQFIRAAETDTAGTIEGFPTTGFDWNTFAFYNSTYVAFHDAVSGKDAVYVRAKDGSPLYSWSANTGETIVGTPQWMSANVSGTETHYLYVGVNGASADSGRVYRLIDNGSSLAADSNWPTVGKTGYFSCTCTVTSALTLDNSTSASYIYWSATKGTAQDFYGITQAAGASINTSFWPVTAPSSVTASSPTVVTISGTTLLYLGGTGTIGRLDVANHSWEQDSPKITTPSTVTMDTVSGRLSYGTSYLTATKGDVRLYAGDGAGYVWAILPSYFGSSPVTTAMWGYNAGSAVTDNYYDSFTDTLQFGTSSGNLVVLNAKTGLPYDSTYNSYPYSLGESISAAPLYFNGVMVVGTASGNLYFIDRLIGKAFDGTQILKKVSFGPTESVSSVGFNSDSSLYMVSTSSILGDGRIYYFDLITDPTSSFQ